MKQKIKYYSSFFLIGVFLLSPFNSVIINQAQAAIAPAEVMEQSLTDIPQLNPGESLTFWVKYKNNSDVSWIGSGSRPLSIRTSSQTSSLYYDSSWNNLYTPSRLSQNKAVEPGQEITFNFILRAPLSSGLYWEKFSLFIGSEELAGSKIEVPLRVVATAEVLPPVTPPVTPPTPKPPVEEKFYWQSIPSQIEIKTAVPQISEPQIEVGLFYIEPTEKQELPIVIEALNNQGYEVRDSQGNLLVRATQGDKLEIEFDFSIERYFISENGFRLLMTDNQLYFIPLQENNIFQITSWGNGPFWGMNVNDNRFSGKLRIHYNPSTERLWVINELPLEEYLGGICEVSDTWPMEFLKAQAVAARTYAYYRMIDPKYTNTPTGEPLFTLQSTQSDQVYRGIGGKERNPNFNKAREETRGIIATYGKDPILAYYFAQSDGRTRNSEEVNMTKDPVPYLKGKIDPPGEGKVMKGHGVGLPQYSGMTAANQGANFSQILKYYYTGIDLTKIY
jgi:hypothetical protein